MCFAGVKPSDLLIISLHLPPKRIQFYCDPNLYDTVIHTRTGAMKIKPTRVPSSTQCKEIWARKKRVRKGENLARSERGAHCGNHPLDYFPADLVLSKSGKMSGETTGYRNWSFPCCISIFSKPLLFVRFKQFRGSERERRGLKEHSNGCY